MKRDDGNIRGRREERPREALGGWGVVCGAGLGKKDRPKMERLSWPGWPKRGQGLGDPGRHELGSDPGRGTDHGAMAMGRGV